MVNPQSKGFGKSKAIKTKQEGGETSLPLQKEAVNIDKRLQLPLKKKLGV